MAITHAAPSKASWDSVRSSVTVDVSAADVALSPPCAAFSVGTSGAVAVRLAGDSGASGADVTLSGLLAGEVYRFEIAVFRQAGATATGIVALY